MLLIGDPDASIGLVVRAIGLAGSGSAFAAPLYRPLARPVTPGRRLVLAGPGRLVALTQPEFGRLKRAWIGPDHVLPRRSPRGLGRRSCVWHL